jgi:hypothetical protein
MEKAHLYEALYLVNHGIDEAVRGVQRLKKSPHLFMETYHKSMAGLERRRSRINLQFMLEMRKLEEDDESRFEEEYNVWLSDEPLTNDEICQLMRGVERERKLEEKPPLVQFLPRSKRPKKTPKKKRRSPFQPQTKWFADTRFARQERSAGARACLGRENLRPCATGTHP